MRKAFVVGHPIRHSRSPLIHGHWLREHAVAGSYERIDVAPEGFAAFLRRFPEEDFIGGNVTIPHKEAAFRAVDHATERARRLGAVNTLWVEGGRLHGDNTDELGFVASLDEAIGRAWERDIRTALVIGAGGAARAVAAGLLDRGVPRILIANRTLARAADVAALDPARMEVLPWEAREGRLPAVDLVVNTTSLGMTGQPPLDLPLDALPPAAIVADIVYVPLETPLLAQARRRGLRAVDGLGMLLHQAVPGFERWFGVRPMVTKALRDIIVADIEGRNGAPQ
jgi:shikimate dehydrogenase